MADGVVLHVTIDHQVIFSWAQRRGARPATFEGDERPWPPLFDFGPDDIGIREIGWDRFFCDFEQTALAFVYRDPLPHGELDDWHVFVKRAAVPELINSGKTTVTMRAI